MLSIIDKNIIAEFVQESLTLLDDAREYIEPKGTSPEGVKVIFRSLHTLKGASGFLELEALSSYVHKFEDFVRDVHERGTGLDQEESAKVLNGLELLQNAVTQPENSDIVDSEPYRNYIHSLYQAKAEKSSLQRLEDLVSDLRSATDEGAKVEHSILLPAIESVEEILYKINIKKTGKALPVDLRTVKTVKAGGKDITPEVLNYLMALEVVALEGKNGFGDLDYKTLDSDFKKLRKIFKGKNDFLDWDIIEDLCEISPEIINEAFKRLWVDVLSESAEIIFKEDEKTKEQKKAPEAKKDQVIEQTEKEEYFRVSSKVINELDHGIGMLVADRNGMENLIQEIKKYLPANFMRHLYDNFADFDRHVNSVEKKVTSLNNKQLKTLFSKVPGIVSSLANELSKKVEVIISGEEIEVPRNIIKALKDPLVHIVRNSLDHGIETPQERKKINKKETGCMKLIANRDDDYLHIHISDDGKGIDPDVIFNKAVKKGVIDEKTLLDRGEILNLIFHPGFSTSENVTSVSGRGVGMDVVKSSVEKAGGTILLDSETGQGTSLNITLPLKKANQTKQILLVDINGHKFGIDYMRVVEVIDKKQSSLHTHKGNIFFAYREDLIKYIDLSFVLTGRKTTVRPSSENRQRILIIEDEQKKRAACAINGIKKKIKVVITGNDHPVIRDNKFVAGCAVFGTEEPFLILDLSDITRFFLKDRG